MYHVVFAPKYKRNIFFADKREEIKDIIKQLCEWEEVEIIEGEICPDHGHLLLIILSKISV